MNQNQRQNRLLAIVGKFLGIQTPLSNWELQIPMGLGPILYLVQWRKYLCGNSSGLRTPWETKGFCNFHLDNHFHTGAISILKWVKLW